MNDKNSAFDQFNHLVEGLDEQFQIQKIQIRQLKSENRKLRLQLEEVRSGQSDIYSQLADADRVKLRQQISNLIELIDSHLEES